MSQSEQERMSVLLTKMKNAQLRDGAPSAEVRIDRINRLINLIVTNRSQLEEAISADFGYRSADTSAFSDIVASVGPLKRAKKELKNWMKAEKRKVDFPLNLFGASARVEFQPKGVIGVVSPWNFPVYLAFGPLAGILAAGNRAMIKPSEYTPRTSELMKELIAGAFDEEEISVVTGGPEVGAAFTSLPFDHMVFTGATSVAKHVMRAAAENLVPLTLELGGKSPTVLGKGVDMPKVARRVMYGKVLNAGQICLAPDYVFVQEDQLQSFVEHAKTAVLEMMPDGTKDSKDYTSIINDRHYDRIKNYVAEAKAAGAEVIEIDAVGGDLSNLPERRLPVTLILNPSDELGVMKEEIFGPVLPVKTYKSIDEVISFVNANDRPLALYYFGSDKAEEAKVLNSTVSGGVTVNDVIFHVVQEDLPFGGVGPSGMGSYHGKDGFLEFSHQKAVYRQVGGDLLKALRPPYGAAYRKQVNGLLK